MNGAASSAVNPSGVQGVCPDGWHLPSNNEWLELVDYLGGLSVAGGPLKDTGTEFWNSPNTGATNETGFSGLPNGGRHYDGYFEQLGTSGPYWTSTEYVDGSYAYNFALFYNTQTVGYGYGNKIRGRAVRCVRDE